MTLFRTTGKRERAVKTLLGGTCEWCDRQVAFPDLVLHRIVPVPGRIPPESPDPQKRFLLLCRSCHQDIHRIPLPNHLQRDLVRRRSPEIRKALRILFDYIPEPYQPPDTADPAEIYEECFSLRSLDLFRAGG
ncbi:MAG: hypothetical protein GKC05_05350 [Methanomicrobiales archaeon]|nr:hypothetical protein [Methanomicrobiales archaeon]NYT20715.1 hypothetical protein [Methanomicrobiales archaeon]